MEELGHLWESEEVKTEISRDVRLSSVRIKGETGSLRVTDRSEVTGVKRRFWASLTVPKTSAGERKN